MRSFQALFTAVVLPCIISSFRLGANASGNRRTMRPHFPPQPCPSPLPVIQVLPRHRCARALRCRHRGRCSRRSCSHVFRGSCVYARSGEMHANSGGRGGSCSRRCCTTHQRSSNVKIFIFAFVFDWWLCLLCFSFSRRRLLPKLPQSALPTSHLLN